MAEYAFFPPYIWESSCSGSATTIDADSALQDKALLMIRDIILYPDKRLETPCDPVVEFDTVVLRQVIDDMFETMYVGGGVGLAVPQIRRPETGHRN